MANKAAFGDPFNCHLCSAVVVYVKSIHEPPQRVMVDHEGWWPGGMAQGMWWESDKIYMSKRHTMHDCNAKKTKALRTAQRQAARVIQERKQVRMFPEIAKPRKPQARREGESAAFRKKADEMLGKR